MADVKIKLTIDSSGAVQSVNHVKGALSGTNVEMNGVASMGMQLNRVFEFAFGAILQRLLSNVVNQLKNISREFKELSMEIQDVNNEFSSVFRNMREQADAFIDRYREVAGFTTVESRKMASEIAGIALSLGETEETALSLAESSAYLALQWERMAGMDIADGQRMITRALVGQVMELQRAGIISREITMTQFQQLNMQQRLDMVTEGLTKRYGDLSQATDGLTQKHRKNQMAIRELRNEIIERLSPAYEGLLENAGDWLSNNREMLSLLGVMVGEALVDLVNMLGRLTDSTNDAADSADKLTGAIGFLIEAKWMWERAMHGLSIGYVQLDMTWSRFMRTLGKLTGTSEQWEQRLREQEDLLKILQLRALELQTEQQKMREQMRKEREEREKLTRQNLEYGKGLSDVGVKTVELTQLTQDMIDKLIQLGELGGELDFELPMDNILAARDLLIRFGDDGRVSIEQIDNALKNINNELYITTDPERQAALLAIADALRAIRGEAMGASDGMAQMVNLSTAAQTAIVELASSLGELFSSLDNVGDFGARVRGLMANLIVDFGRMLVSLGTMSLAISQWNPLGMIAAGTAAIAVGSAMKARTQSAIGGGGTASQGTTPTTVNSGGLRGLPTGGVTQNTTASFKQALSEIKWKVTTDVKLGKLMIEMENEQRKISGTL
jgi:hypothetical protein